MKNKISRYLPLFCLAAALVGCNEVDYLKQEQYEKIIYTLGNTDFVYDVTLKMLDENSIEGRIPVGLSGTLSDDEDIVVTFEKDGQAIEQYNILNFGFQSERYAKELEPDNYEMESPVAVIRAGSEVGTLPIVFKTEGLSPDSIYFIPLRIGNVSKYRFMEERCRVLCRPRLENRYASEQKYTLYASDGKSKVIEDGKPKGADIMFSATKLVMPITYNRIRTTVHGNTDRRDEAYLRKYSMYITVGEDGGLVIQGTDPALEVVQSEGEGMNVWDEASRTFRLLYTYRDPVGGKTVLVKENLRLLTEIN